MRIPLSMLALLLIGLVSEDRPLTMEEARRFLRSTGNPDGAWSGSCWDDGEDEDDYEQDLAARQRDTARYAAQYGLPPLETLRDMLTLLTTAGVVHLVPDPAGVLRLYPACPLPRPQDVFPLDEAELAAQHQLQWSAAYGGDASRIIELFQPRGERRKEITTSLDRLARVIDGHPHDAREAVLLLVEAGDFTTSLPVAGMLPHKVFRLCCDWKAFDAHRIGVHGRDEQDRIRVTVPDSLLDRATLLPLVVAGLVSRWSSAAGTHASCRAPFSGGSRVGTWRMRPASRSASQRATD
nr:DUF6042 family protein [Streptacidiphilus anmyonensis]